MPTSENGPRPANPRVAAVLGLWAADEPITTTLTRMSVAEAVEVVAGLIRRGETVDTIEHVLVAALYDLESPRYQPSCRPGRVVFGEPAVEGSEDYVTGAPIAAGTPVIYLDNGHALTPESLWALTNYLRTITNNKEGS